jgi:cyclopropane fatty-acyl-phospholipid synthase-like methyltransferase
MLRELGDAAETSPAPRRLARLRRLPQPLHLLEFVVGSQHYHFGCFEHEEESLCAAQDRLAHLGAERLSGAVAVLDIGCGLGGTSRVLAELGRQVTALDPCPEAVAYARTCLPANGRAPVRFLAAGFEAFASAPGAQFDGAIAIEVLQHFPVLARFFECCRARLRPGARLVVHDVACELEADWERVPFHRRGRLAGAAGAAGFEVEAQADLTRAILPTLPRLARAVEERRAELHAVFGTPGAARPVEAELAQVLGHMRALQDALERGYLRYESTLLRLAGSRGAR